MQKQTGISCILQNNRANYLLKGVILFIFLVTPYVGLGQTVYISKKDPTIGTIFDEIEKNTNYHFFYDKALDLSIIVALPATVYDLNTLLVKTFENTNYDFKIGHKIIGVKYNLKREIARNQVAYQNDDYKVARASHKTFHVVLGVIRNLRTKEPIEDAAIMFSGDALRETFSKEDGIFILTALPSGEYDITVLHKGYNLKREKINISGAYNLNIEIELVPNIVRSGIAESYTLVSSYRENLEWLDASILFHRPEIPQKIHRPKFALKTNLILWATTSINLGFEVKLSDKTTFDLPISYNPWEYSNNKLFRHFLVQPEIRYWTRESFNGHFIGFNLTYAFFNIGGLKAPFGLFKDLRKYRYEGNLYGAGISYGYQWILSNKISLEATAGLGYTYLNYDKFACKTCAPLIKSDNKHYVGLTKLGLSISYFIR